MSHRIESDSLGEVKVPSEALYGAQTQRAVDNFPISEMRFPRRFIEALGLIKKAACKVNLELGLIDSDKAEAITKAAEAVRRGEHDSEFVIDIFQTGSGTSTNMNTNEVIGNLATQIMGGKLGEKLVHPNDHVNMSQSSNDTIPTAMHISARMAIKEELMPALESFQSELEKKAVEFDHVLKSGRTHLMDATPVRLGQEFGGYAAQIRKCKNRIASCAIELEELAQGGTAVGTGINVHPDFPSAFADTVAGWTDVDFKETDNHFEAQAARDAYVSTAGSLSTLAVALVKIVNDIRHLSSGPTSGLKEISLPVIQPGSSIMPGKVNPVMSEAVMMVAARVFGNTETITVSGMHGNFELNVMLPVSAHAMLQSISILANGMNAFRENCLSGIKANEDRCKELLELNPSIATALNRSIGYDKASKVAKKSAAEGKSVIQVVLEEKLMTEEEIKDVLDIRAMTEPGLPGE